MTIWQRAAGFAAMTFTLAVALGTSTPGWAKDLDRSAMALSGPLSNSVAVVAIPAFNSAIGAPVPAIVAPAVPADDTVAALAEPDFDTLAEAVAAQDDTATDDAERCLAGAVYFEARGESLSGQLAVANVIINRSKSRRFPSDICSVVKQRGQFSFVRGGDIPAMRSGNALTTAIAVAKVALAAAWDSPAPKALFFNAAGRRPGGSLVRIAAIGNHVFYR